MTDFLHTLTVGDVLTLLGVLVMAAVMVWKHDRSEKVLRVILHQTNSMQDEMQRLAKAEGRANAEAEQRKKGKR